MTPILMFLGFSLPFVALLATAAAWGVYPSLRAVLLGLIPVTATLGLVVLESAWVAVLIVDVAYLVIIIRDLFTVPRKNWLRCERNHAKVASLKKRHPVSLTITSLAPWMVKAVIRDGADRILQPTPPLIHVALRPGLRTVVDYELRPQRRGAFSMSAVYIRGNSRYGLWFRQMTYPCETVLHVYPDIKQLSEYAMLARVNRLSLIGVRRVRRVGHEDEFERLRDYTIDDEYRWIDWRATARRRKLTVKDFQQSQSQRVVFMVDCGRMMTNEWAGLSMLDHTWNAVLLLAYVALKHGDSVGLLAFSDEIHAFLNPRGGKHQMARLINMAFDRFPRMVESRYDLAFRYLAAHVRKRTLVVLVTHLIDDVNGRQVERYLTNLAGRHLPLGVFLRDHTMFAPLSDGQKERDDLWKAAAAARILTWRHQVITSIRSKGALVLDVFPEEMTAPLVNQYLEIKARRLL
ncbi:MAG TPA: DUF58 domain-containing protein [Thermogutta sp.]|nr:DUF58 domain-containing protein [Thermogutta sp.]